MKHVIGLAVCLALCSPSVAAPEAASRGIVVDGDGMIFVFDTEPGSVIGAIRLDQIGSSTSDCVISADGRRGFVAASHDRVWVIDLASSPPQLATGINPIPISGIADDVSLTADGRFLVVASVGFASAGLSVIDVASRSVVDTFNPGSLTSVDVCTDGTVLVGSSQSAGSGRIRRFLIDAAGQLTDTGESLPIVAPYNVYCAPAASSGIAMTIDGQIQSFRIPGLTAVSHRALPAQGSSGTLTKDGTRFYGWSFDGISAFDFDQATGELGAAPIFETSLGGGPFFGGVYGSEQVALDVPDRKIYVPDQHRLDVVDATTGAVLAPFPMPDLLYSGAICFGPRPATECVVAACDDGNPCTDDVCGDAGCLHVPDDTNLCGDPESCRDRHVCQDGACVAAGPADCNTPCPPGFETSGTACLKTYEIGAGLLDNLDESCDGTGLDRFNCQELPFGFHWSDTAGSGVGPVVFVDVRFIGGVACEPGFSELSLNGMPIYEFQWPLACTCTPNHTPFTLYPPAERYAKNAVNSLTIVPSGPCEGLSAGPLLGGPYARVLVAYAQLDPACSTGSCNAATDRCEYAVTDCDDGNPCTADTCGTDATCIHGPEPYGTPCDDGDTCDGSEYCDGYGSCDSVYAPQCDDFNPCTLDGCDPDLGCTYAPSPAGTPCDDYNSCTTDDACDGALSCVGRSPCDDGLPCTDDLADEHNACACSHPISVSGTPCDDGNPCTDWSACDGTGGGASACVGETKSCDDRNPCTDDRCDAVLGCVHANNASPCDDYNACTEGDTCSAGVCRGIVVTCDDGNPCTDDSCHPVAGCRHADNTGACDDGDPGTQNDACHAGQCVGQAPCVASDDPKTKGWWHSQCTSGGHSGGSIDDADALCVAAAVPAFAGITTATEVCTVLDPSHGNNGAADRAERQLMALALNVCDGRLCPSQGLDATCSRVLSVGQAISEASAVLLDSARTDQELQVVACQAEEINNGHALELDTLRLNAEDSKVRLTWLAPTLDDGSGTPSRYKVWRRSIGSMAPFDQIGTTTGLTYLDETTGAFEYEVTPVVN